VCERACSRSHALPLTKTLCPAAADDEGDAAERMRLYDAKYKKELKQETLAIEGAVRSEADEIEVALKVTMPGTVRDSLAV